MTPGSPPARDGDSQGPMAPAPYAVRFIRPLYVLQSTRLLYVAFVRPFIANL